MYDIQVIWIMGGEMFLLIKFLRGLSQNCKEEEFQGNDICHYIHLHSSKLIREEKVIYKSALFQKFSTFCLYKQFLITYCFIWIFSPLH